MLSSWLTYLGECFIFSIQPKMAVFHSTGKDENFQMLTGEHLAMGGQPGWLLLSILSVDFPWNDRKVWVDAEQRPKPGIIQRARRHFPHRPAHLQPHLRHRACGGLGPRTGTRHGEGERECSAETAKLGHQGGERRPWWPRVSIYVKISNMENNGK